MQKVTDTQTHKYAVEPTVDASVGYLQCEVNVYKPLHRHSVMQTCALYECRFYQKD